MPTPDDQRFPDGDLVHVQQFYSIWPESRYEPLLFPSRLGSRIGVELYNAGLPHTVTVYRFAILALMSYLNNRPESETFGYLSKYYQEIQKLFERNTDSVSIFEVVLASYVVAVYSLIGGKTLQMALDNCSRFCSAAMALKSIWTGEGDELIWIETLWRYLLSSLYHVHRDVILFSHPENRRELAKSLAKLQALLNNCSPLLASAEDISRLPLSMTTEAICQKVEALCVFMQFYLDHFLFLVTYEPFAESTPSVRAGLCSVLDRIIQLIGRLPNIADYIHHAYAMPSEWESLCKGTANNFLDFPDIYPRGLRSVTDGQARDTALALLYTFARLVKTVLENPADADKSFSRTVQQSAIVLCRLCATFPMPGTTMDTLLVKRTLFWAGLVLTKSKFPMG